MTSFRFNGVDVHVADSTLPPSPNGSKYIVTSGLRGVPPLTFWIKWDSAPDDARVFDVFAHAIDRAIRAVEKLQPKWRDVYCG